MAESQRAPYHYEADDLEEKNQIFRLLSLIVNQNRSNVTEAQQHYSSLPDDVSKHLLLY